MAEPLQKSGIKLFYSEMVNEILESILPDRTKRLLLIGSLCPKLMTKDKITHEYLVLLNTQLSLSREEDAIKVPIALSQRIWSFCPFTIKQQPMKDRELTIYVKRIVDSLPDWLRYDQDSVIVQELIAFFKFTYVFNNDGINRIVME